MSERNVKLVLAAGERIDEAGGAIPELVHDDAVLTAPEGWPEPGPFRGKSAVLRQFERLFGDYSTSHSTDMEVVADENDWVVFGFRWHTLGAGSGIANTWEMACAVRIEDRRFIEMHYRWSEEEALEAAGLSR